MSVNPRGKGFQVDVKLSGVRHRPFFETELKATMWEADARHADKMGRPLPEANNATVQGGGRIETLGDLFDEVTKTRWSTKNAKASSFLIRNGRLFTDHLGRARLITSIKSADFYSYVDHCRSLGNENATINRKVSAGRTMLRVAMQREIIPGVPYCEKFRESAGSVNYFEFGEEDPILTHLKHRGLYMLYDLVIFLIDTGARIQEALTVDWKTIHGGRLRLENRKNGSFGVIPLTKRATLALNRRRIHSTNADRPFGDIVYKWAVAQLSKVYEHLGGRYLDVTQPLHVFRHSCASRLAIAGIDANRIKEWMDHSSLLVTQRYVKLSPKNLEVGADALDRMTTPVKAKLKVVKKS